MQIVTQNESLLSDAQATATDRQASQALVKYAVFAALIGASATFIGIGITEPNVSVRTLGPMLMTGVALTSWRLQVRGRAALAIWVLALGVWVVMTGVAAFTGGVRAPVIVVYPAVILIVGWLINARAAVALAALSVATTLALLVAESLAYLPQPDLTPTLVYALNQVVIYVISAVLAVFALRAYQNQVRQLRSAASELVQLTFDLETSEAQLQRAQSVAKVGSWIYDIAGDEMKLSVEACRIFGLSESQTTSYGTYLARIHPDDRSVVDQAWDAALQGDVFDCEHRVQLGTTSRWIHQKLELEFAPDGRPLRVVGVTQEITGRKLAELARVESEKQLRAFYELNLVGLTITSPGKVWIRVNECLCNMLEYSEAQLRGMTWEQLTHPDDLAADNERFSKMLAGEISGYSLEERFISRTGRIVATLLVVRCARKENGVVDYVTAMVEDITERKTLEEQVRQLAFYDVLTKLPNRRLLSERLGQAMLASKRSGRYSALMFLDLDNFKPLNDLHGHSAGDFLLVEVADRLKRCVREVDTVARFGGDEFVVMLNELEGDEDDSVRQSGAIAEKIRVALAQPYLLSLKSEGQPEALVEHHSSASIGVIVFINHETRQEDILKWADKAMYQAKGAGRNSIRFYDLFNQVDGPAPPTQPGNRLPRAS